jgi:hypothetical protein
MNARGVDPDSQYAILNALAATDPTQTDAPTPPWHASAPEAHDTAPEEPPAHQTRRR